MAIHIIMALAFISGFICADLKGWSVWLPFAAFSGLLTGFVGRFLGVI